MTLEEMMVDVWEALGDETDLDPYDAAGDVSVTTAGGAKLVDALNRAQTVVAHWKDPSTGALVRFRELLGEMYFEHGVATGQVQSLATDSQVGLVASTNTDYVDRYNGWALKIGNEIRMVMDTAVSGGVVVVTVNDDFDAATDEDDWTLMKRFSYILPAGHAWASDHIVLPTSSDLHLGEGNLILPLRITDMERGRELIPAKRSDDFITRYLTEGDPQRWYFFGKKLYFDVAPSENRWFHMEYYRNPVEMAAASDEPEIPETFHYAMVLWAIEWGYRRNGESNEKYSTKRDFLDFMRSTKTPDDMEPERVNFGGSLKMRR